MLNHNQKRLKIELRLFCLIVLAVLLATTAIGVSGADARARKYFDHYMATCPDHSGCGSEYNQTVTGKGYDEIRYWVLSRKGGKDAGWMMGFSVLRYGTSIGGKVSVQPSGGEKVAISVGDKAFQLPWGDGYMVIGNYLIPTPEVTELLVQAIRAGSSIKLSFATERFGRVTVPYSLKGLEKSARWIEEVQKNTSAKASSLMPISQNELLQQY